MTNIPKTNRMNRFELEEMWKSLKQDNHKLETSLGKLVRPCLKKRRGCGGWDVTQVVQCLYSSKDKAPDSIHSTMRVIGRKREDSIIHLCNERGTR